MSTRRVFLELAYHGQAFNGWQRQPGARTVQGELETALATLARAPVEVTGCGRTDTGVHAATAFAHADLPGEALTRAREGLNGLLPRGIRVRGVHPVHAEAHARFDAVQRAYAYRLHRKPDPFLEGLSHAWPYPEWDLAAMNRAADHLRGFSDFRSFQKTGSDAKTARCRVDLAFWEPDPLAPPESEGWVFRIAADRFLRGMVRLVVGALFEVGRGRLSPAAFRDTVASGERFARSTAAPAHGLYLHRIRYPYAVGPYPAAPVLPGGNGHPPA